MLVSIPDEYASHRSTIEYLYQVETVLSNHEQVLDIRFWRYALYFKYTYNYVIFIQIYDFNILSTAKIQPEQKMLFQQLLSSLQPIQCDIS
jgi:hypothetical protein